MDYNHRKRAQHLTFCIILFVFIIIHAFFEFEGTFFTRQLQQQQQELEKTAKIKGESINQKYSMMVASLEALAENIKNYSNNDEKDITAQLKLLAKVGYFDYVVVGDMHGNAIDCDYGRVNIHERSYYQEAMKGKITISDVMESQVRTGEQIQVVAVPVFNQDTVVGVVFGVINIGTMDKLLENETGSDIYTQIVDSKGNYITKLKAKDALIMNKNAWEDLESCKFLEGSLEEVKKDLKDKKSGTITIALDDEERVSFYVPLEINEYYMFTSIDRQYIRNQTEEINREVFLMILEIAVAFVIMAFGLYQFNKKVREELQISHAKAVSSEEMMSIAIQQTKHVVFEYDIKTKRLEKRAGVQNHLFHKKIMENVPESIINKGIIDPEFVPKFRKLFEDITEREDNEETVKVETEIGEQWFKVIIKNIYDNKKHIIKTVGIAEDITDEKIQEELVKKGKKEKQTLKKRAEIDGLTGLYNAETAKLKITDFLESSWKDHGKHLFILMDLDNFKQINDTFGHQYGDQVLREVAEILRKKFRKDDILGRLGGDEFIALLINATGFETMEHVFRELCQELKKTYTKDGKSVTISASFGITTIPDHGKNFRELYEKTDVMLYEVKGKTKNGYKLYHI